MDSPDGTGSGEAAFPVGGVDAAAAIVLGADGGVLLWTPAARRLLGDASAEDLDRRLRRALAAGDGDDGGVHVGTAVLTSASGEPTGFRYTARPLNRPWSRTPVRTGTESLNQPRNHSRYRPETPSESPIRDRADSVGATGERAVAEGGARRRDGWLVTLVPVDEAIAREAARERAERIARLGHAAAAGIGATLDLDETTRRLVDVLVPDLGDLATVDLAEPVLRGDEPMFGFHAIPRFRRVAVSAAGGPDAWPAELLSVGDLLPEFPGNVMLRPVVEGVPMVVSDMPALREALGIPPEALSTIVPAGAHSILATPLFARGLVLGTVSVWRTGSEAEFDQDEAEMLAEIASRAALSVDNARRYTREHRAAIALQRSLLPRSVSRTPAADTAGTYLPAEGDAGVGGDWFDVITLSSLRTGFVVGDVIGHGLGATAAMGRLRTAVQALADLDLEPSELLSHVDDLVLSYWPDHESGETTPELAAQGATFLYAVYDPVSRLCTMASAGHPPPLVLRPGGEPEFVELTPGPPLGVGGMPFESVEFELPGDSVLAFFTDGLLDQRRTDMGAVIEEFKHVIAGHRGRALTEVGAEVMTTLRPRREDDVALLLARTRAVPDDAIAEWELPADPSVVSRARELATAQLGAWGLDELAFTTELVVSELVTNAIRYAGAPVQLRLIRDEVLVCEVADPSNTQPRLRRAIATDEGGRGLFLVAQLTSRWGSRYRRTGKTIWTEQGVKAPDA